MAKRVFTNQAIVSPSFDGDANSGNVLALGTESQSFDADIPYELGSEEVTNGDFATGDTTGWLYSGTGTVVYESGAARVTAGATTAGGIFSAAPDLSLILGGVYLLECDITISQLTSGTVKIQLFDNGVSKELTSTGTYSISELVTITDADCRFYGHFLGQAIGDNYLIDNISVKQITNPNSYLNYYDDASGVFVSVDNSDNDPVTTHTMDVDCQNVFATTVPLTDADRTYLLSSPESALNMLLEAQETETTATDTNLSFDSDDIYSYFAGNEGSLGGANVYDLTDDTFATSKAITGYTSAVRTTLENQNTEGTLQNVMFNRDATGRILSARDDYSMATDNLDDGNVGIAFKPNLDSYTLMEVISGELQDFGSDSIQSATTVPSGCVES